ncbi:hypothetical protein HDV02_005384 [Globomyces sp. JEL0801]|nr:hypothetical protein HDV02_005384 [Globomyces sp. JEL0801]
MTVEENIWKQSSGMDSLPTPIPSRTASPSTHSKPVYTLAATADTEQLILQALQLQSKLKAQIDKLNQSVESHRLQAVENRTLKQYVANLLSTTSRLGTDALGNPLPTVRRT